MADSSPLTLVLNELRSGTTLRSDISRSTGLTADVVDAAVEHLLRMGLVNTQTLASGCPDSGCGGCASPTGSGCTSAAGSTPGPVLVSLTRRP